MNEHEVILLCWVRCEKQIALGRIPDSGGIDSFRKRPSEERLIICDPLLEYLQESTQ